jgi:hypothetical protein
MGPLMEVTGLFNKLLTMSIMEPIPMGITCSRLLLAKMIKAQVASATSTRVAEQGITCQNHTWSTPLLANNQPEGALDH